MKNIFIHPICLEAVLNLLFRMNFEAILESLFCGIFKIYRDKLRVLYGKDAEKRPKVTEKGIENG